LKILNYEDFNQKHNEIVINLFNNEKRARLKENILEEVPLLQNPPSELTNFNLFFVNRGYFYEYQSINEVIVKKCSVGSNNIRELLLEEIRKSNKLFTYEEDLTIFTIEEEPTLTDDDINLKSDGGLISVLVAILFIINYLMCNPEKIYYDFNVLMSSKFEKTPSGYDLLNNDIYDIASLEKFYFDIFKKLYSVDSYDYYRKNQATSITKVNTTSSGDTST